MIDKNSVPISVPARAMTDGQRELERLKDGFMNTLVRDIRLPLTSVLGLLELFESKLQTREPFDMEDRQLLSSAIEHGDKMRRLLDDYLEVSRQQERPLTLHSEAIEAIKLLEDVAEPLRGEAALRGVELNVNVSVKGLTMYVDVRETRRAVCHLLEAALAMTPDGGIINVEAKPLVGTRAGDEGRHFVLINVADSSDGIPAEEVPFVFDAFWQAAHSRTAAGCGVGLAIAKRVAAAHGGNVAVRSQISIGTIYSLVLPASQQETLVSRQRILIVEDGPELLLLLKKLVTRMGYQVETASGAHVALEILREKSFDLLLTDWAMPQMSGGELIQAMKRDEHLRNIPTIVLTGHDTDVERLGAQAARADCFLVKPVMRDKLQHVITELLLAKTRA